MMYVEIAESNMLLIRIFGKPLRQNWDTCANLFYVDRVIDIVDMELSV